MASAGSLVATDERAELQERAGVDEVVDAGAGVELPCAAVLGQPLLAAHGAAATRRCSRSSRTSVHSSEPVGSAMGTSSSGPHLGGGRETRGGGWERETRGSNRPGAGDRRRDEGGPDAPGHS